MKANTHTLYLADESETNALAQRLSPLLSEGGRLYLIGDLGAGKTHFVRALLRSSGVTGRIKSPTFTLVEPYKVSNLYFYHFDFYRFNDPREWIDAGFRDVFNDDAVVLVEWPDKAAGHLPEPDLTLELIYDGDGRQAVLTASSARGQVWLNTLFPPMTPTTTPT